MIPYVCKEVFPQILKTSKRLDWLIVLSAPARMVRNVFDWEFVFFTYSQSC